MNESLDAKYLLVKIITIFLVFIIKAIGLNQPDVGCCKSRNFSQYCIEFRDFRV